jgi:hypothetical protein
LDAFWFDTFGSRPGDFAFCKKVTGLLFDCAFFTLKNWVRSRAPQSATGKAKT